MSGTEAPADARQAASATASAAAGHPDRELQQLAQLAFATRQVQAQPGRPALPLALLPADALDLDLDDPEQRDFGDYELVEKIGQGGMGVVYRARQHSLQRDVALKLLGAGPWASADFIERFRSEARSAAQLEHPNIVTVFESGTQHDLHFFSMRLVRGESLAERLQREGPPSPREAARLLRTTADALDYAHRLGVLHLDLKPGNVLIDSDGQPMVADFGLARRMDQALAEHGDDVSGTPSYMAPEQARAHAQRIGRCTDIYGLGSILYETLTGRPPFLARTPQATLRSVVSARLVPPRELRPDIPRDLEAICLKCLQRDPGERYASAGELADDLQAFLEDRAVRVRRPSTLEALRRWLRREPRLALAIGSLLLVLAAGLAATAHQWWRAEASASAARTLLWEGRRETALQLQSDGRGFDAMGKLLDNLAEQEPGTQAGTDRRVLGLLLAQGAVLLDRIVVADANPLSAALSPDGTRLVLAMNDLSVRWYDTATLEEQGRVSLAERVDLVGAVRAPLLLRFSGPDRVRVTEEWISIHPAPTDGASWLVDLVRGEVVEPPAAFAQFGDAIFSADGGFALLRSRQRRIQLWRVDPWQPVSPLSPPMAPSTATLQSTAWLVGQGGRVVVELLFGQRELVVRDAMLGERHRVRLPAGGRVSAWNLSSDARLLALGEFEGRLHVVDLHTGSLRTLPASRGREITWVDFSDDGAWLAAASRSGTAQVFDVSSGDMLAGGVLRHDHALYRVRLDRDQSLMLAEGEGRTSVWRLPLPGPRAAPAWRIPVGPSDHVLTGRFAVGAALGQGLVATAGVDGQVRLWRLPPAALLPARAAPQLAEGEAFDGSELVDLQWDAIRLGRGPWRALPQPPGFLEVLRQGRQLVFTAGAGLHGWGLDSWAARHAPVALPATPQRLVASDDGSRLLLGFAGHGERGMEERLWLLDAATGQRLAEHRGLPGPLRRLDFDAGGGRVLALGALDGVTTVLDGRSLEVLDEFAHDPHAPVQWAAFGHGQEVLLVTRAADPRMARDQLLRWLPGETAPAAEHALGDVRPLAVSPLPEAGVLVAGAARDLLLRDGVAVALPRRAHSEPTAVVALSSDGAVLARGFRREVQLHDARSGQAIGPPLQGEGNAVDVIVRLRFSDDGRSLVARTLLGRWHRWPVAAERRPLADLVALHRGATWGASGGQSLLVPPPHERARLRASDPGPASGRVPRRSMDEAHRTEFGDAVPLRPASVPEAALDLGPVYDMGPESVANPFWNLIPHLRPMPAGLLRLRGVDFDVRGVAQVSTMDWAEPRSDSVRARGVRCLPVPSRPVAAVHLLATGMMPVPAAAGTVLGWLRLQYRDGGSVELPLRAGHELFGHRGEDQQVPYAFAPDAAAPLLGYSSVLLSAPRLENPEPRRPLRCVDVLGAGEPTRPLLLLAATIEPAGTGQGNSAADPP